MPGGYDGGTGRETRVGVSYRGEDHAGIWSFSMYIAQKTFIYAGFSAFSDNKYKNACF